MRMRKKKQQPESNSQKIIQPKTQPPALFSPKHQEQAADLSSLQQQAQQPGVNFADIPIFSPEDTATSVPIQPKLTIGQPNDKYEREADRVAHQVVSQIHTPQASALQRDNLEEDETVQTKSQLKSRSAFDQLRLKADRGEAMSGESMLESSNNAIAQCFGNIVTGVAPPNFESSLNRAKGVCIQRDS